MCMCVQLSVCTCATRMQYQQRLEEGIRSLELKIKAAVSHCVCTENQSQVF